MELIAEQLETKKQLLAECFSIQSRLVETAKEAMLQAQESANEEQGSIEDNSESFKSQLQIDRDMYARQVEEAINSFNQLRKIDVTKEGSTIALGSVVVTDTQNFFISISLGEISVDGKKYFAISTSTPLYKEMAGKTKGETFKFRDKKYRIERVY
jgi:methionyl-tRNA formyltransferase